MLSGKIQGLVPEKGFGFIKADSGGPDLFFHCSATQGRFETFVVGQAVHYEINPDSAKPSAKLVTPVGGSRAGGNTDQGRRTGQKTSSRERGSAAARSSSRVSRSGTPRGQARPAASGTRRRSFGEDRPQTPALPANCRFGFVTRLNRHKSIGFISAVEGGPEFLFEARHVMGLKRFAAIEPSEYVRFEVETEEVDPKQPKARCVMAIERQIDSGEKMVARHPKARRKKPTWRG